MNRFISSLWKRLPEGVKDYLSEVAIYSFMLIIYRLNNYYWGFIKKQTWQIMLTFFLGYIILGLPYYLWIAPRIKNRKPRARIVLRFISRYLKSYLSYLKSFNSAKLAHIPPADKVTKVSILFLLVKLYYIPIMLNFVIGHTIDLPRRWQILKIAVTHGGNAFEAFYFFALSFMFFWDTLYYSFGYLVESRYLDNEVRSVEPTVFGWFVALGCYPPFNDLVSRYLPWHPNESAYYGNQTLTVIFRLLIIALTFIYLWATLALGAKCSNLTNRGIVDRGPYAYVRHPAYISKNLAWWLMILPQLSLAKLLHISGWAPILSGLGWSLIYFFRAITEERHLIEDPDYQKYCKKVRWRFIPYVF